MNNHPRLSPTGIEYGDYAWNFYSGCRHKQQGKCPPEVPCWAEGITKRFKGHYPNGFEPTFYPEALLSPLHVKKPSRILCAFMGDLFGDWVDWSEDYGGTLGEDEAGTYTIKGRILETIQRCPHLTFIFLTKNPAAMIKWSGMYREKWPGNCWLGASVTANGDMTMAYYGLSRVKAGKRFVSFEPLLGMIGQDELRNAAKVSDWWIIGRQTPASRKTEPRLEWVREIIEAADRAGIPVFLKDNLGWPRITDDGSPPFYRKSESGTWILRQEFPV